jgi:hypothetical protein
MKIDNILEVERQTNQLLLDVMTSLTCFKCKCLEVETSNSTKTNQL